MKIYFIECTAEELRANRTIMDNITEAMSSITRSFAGFDVTPEQMAEAMANNEEPDEEDEDD